MDAADVRQTVTVVVPVAVDVTRWAAEYGVTPAEVVPAVQARILAMVDDAVTHTDTTAWEVI